MVMTDARENVAEMTALCRQSAAKLDAEGGKHLADQELQQTVALYEITFFLFSQESTQVILHRAHLNLQFHIDTQRPDSLPKSAL